MGPRTCSSFETQVMHYAPQAAAQQERAHQLLRSLVQNSNSQRAQRSFRKNLRDMLANLRVRTLAVASPHTCSKLTLRYHSGYPHLLWRSPPIDRAAVEGLQSMRAF